MKTNMIFNDLQNIIKLFYTTWHIYNMCACYSHSLSFKTIRRNALWSNHQRNRRELRVRGQAIFVVVCLPRVLYASWIRDVMRRVGEI